MFVVINTVELESIIHPPIFFCHYLLYIIYYPHVVLSLYEGHSSVELIRFFLCVLCCSYSAVHTNYYIYNLCVCVLHTGLECHDVNKRFFGFHFYVYCVFSFY